jgi:hypothetical protein
MMRRGMAGTFGSGMAPPPQRQEMGAQGQAPLGAPAGVRPVQPPRPGGGAPPPTELPPGAIPVGVGDPRLQAGGHMGSDGRGRTGGYYRPDAGDDAADYYLEKPGFNTFDPTAGAHALDPRLVAAMSAMGMDANDLRQRHRFEAMFDPRMATMAARAGANVPFSADMAGLAPQLRNLLLGNAQKQMTGDRLKAALLDGSLTARGGPSQGSVGNLSPQQAPMASIQDVIAQRQRFADRAGLEAPPDRRVERTQPVPRTAPPGEMDKRQGQRDARRTDTQQTVAGKQLAGMQGETGKVVEIRGRKYRKNKNGAWVDVTDPNARERVTNVQGKALPGKKKAA